MKNKPPNRSDFLMPSKCSRKLTTAPIKFCALAMQRLSGHEGCEWFVNDSESKYCFWYYLHLHPNELHSVTAISKLWGTSVNNVSIAERSAHVKILKRFKEDE